MKKNRLFLLITFMLLVGMLLVACGGGGEEEAAEPEAPAAQSSETEVEAAEPEEAEVEEAPSAAEAEDEEIVADVAEEPMEEESQTVSEPEEAAAEEAPAAETSEEESSSPIAEMLQISEIDADEGLENYEMSLSMNFTTEDDVAQVITADIVYGTNPDAMSMNISMEGVEGAEEFGSMSMVQLDGTSYMVVPGLGCINAPVDDSTDNPFADLTNSDQVLEGVNNANFVGEETINGVNTLHYTFDETNLTPEEAQDIEWVEGHIYLAKDGDYMVRFVMEGEGGMDQFGTGEDQFGTMRMEYDIAPIDGAVSVEIPAECANSGADNSPYPILDDASEYSSFGGLISYMTAVPLDEAATFYDDGLAADGWTKDEGAGMYVEGSLVNATYTRDGESINVMISADEDAGMISVLIIEGE